MRSTSTSSRTRPPSSHAGPGPPVLNPHNPEIAGAHLPCAAAELPLRAGEPWLSEPESRALIAELEERGDLLRSDDTDEWFAARRHPHRAVNLREAGASYAIVRQSNG